METSSPASRPGRHHPVGVELGPAGLGVVEVAPGHHVDALRRPARSAISPRDMPARAAPNGEATGSGRARHRAVGRESPAVERPVPAGSAWSGRRVPGGRNGAQPAHGPRPERPPHAAVRHRSHASSPGHSPGPVATCGLPSAQAECTRPPAFVTVVTWDRTADGAVGAPSASRRPCRSQCWPRCRTWMARKAMPMAGGQQRPGRAGRPGRWPRVAVGQGDQDRRPAPTRPPAAARSSGEPVPNR